MFLEEMLDPNLMARVARDIAVYLSSLPWEEAQDEFEKLPYIPARDPYSEDDEEAFDLIWHVVNQLSEIGVDDVVIETTLWHPTIDDSVFGT